MKMAKRRMAAVDALKLAIQREKGLMPGDRQSSDA